MFSLKYTVGCLWNLKYSKQGNLNYVYYNDGSDWSSSCYVTCLVQVLSVVDRMYKIRVPGKINEY